MSNPTLPSAATAALEMLQECLRVASNDQADAIDTICVQLKAALDSNGVGEMGLPYSVCGSVAQELAAQAVERGNVRPERMIEFLQSGFDEDAFWNQFGGPATDWFEDNASSDFSKQFRCFGLGECQKDEVKP